MDLLPLQLARIRLPGSAGLLSVLGAAGPGTTSSVRCFMAWPVRVMLSSSILWATITRWSWQPCYMGTCLGGDFLPALQCVHCH